MKSNQIYDSAGTAQFFQPELCDSTVQGELKNCSHFLNSISKTNKYRYRYGVPGKRVPKHKTLPVTDRISGQYDVNIIPYFLTKYY
jgi:hypothetical protein